MGFLARLLLYAAICWAPLPLGSNRPFAWVLNGLVAVAASGLFVISELRRTRPLAIEWLSPAIAAASFLMIVVWMWVQAIPGLPKLFRHPVWETLAGSV